MKILKHQHWHLLILIGLLYALNQYTNQDSNVFNGSLWNISTKNWFILAILSPIIHQIYVLFCWRYELFYKGLTNIFKENAFNHSKKFDLPNILPLYEELYNNLKRKTIEEIWNEELNILKSEYLKYKNERIKIQNGESKETKKTNKKLKIKN